MRNPLASCVDHLITCLSLAAILLSVAPLRLDAQAPPAVVEMQDLRDEVSQLKKRLAQLEAKLEARLEARVEAKPVAPTSQAPAPPPPPAVAAAPASEQPASKPAPFAFGDFTWMNGQSRQKSQPLSNSFATVNLYLDTYFGYSFNQPRDNTIIGSGAVGRNTEWQINNATIGVDTSYKNMLGKLTLQVGNQLAVTQDLDQTVNRGRNLSVSNNKYIGEAVAGYHFDKWNGVNVEAGYFYSYIGLESYLLAENWNYKRSFVAAFTPFYFSG